MTRLATIAAALAISTSLAQAGEQSAFYGPDGRRTGTATTSGNTTTFYDAQGPARRERHEERRHHHVLRRARPAHRYATGEQTMMSSFGAAHPAGYTTRSFSPLKVRHGALCNSVK